MTARVFAPLPRILTRTFRETAAAVWHRHRDDGSTASDPLVVIFNASSDVADADGISMRFGVPIASCAMADALKLEPTRAGNPNEIFRIDGADELVIDGAAYDVESCRADGYGMLTIVLRG
ncbi:head-tail joining protein [Agrobacterium genomosp. 2]|uniref:Uncharacterized protein n=1 Tax=Agrobacterium genomosp. 2 str. CFBP 5494 TaxID=1183436 RepID=A0A9W5AYK0_9HYPH|nr:hypothetical protein [Agrobacterium genomosp. 2]CUW87475.1 hypothetical protein AGR2A_Cc120062 [Agrobacterium genomosp. 2 str. CFBP 5494]